jgi:hypothetical protein
MTPAAMVARVLGGRRAGRWWSCRCPVHDDDSPSLSLRDGDRRLIIKCWAGCDPRDVLAELRRRGLLACRAEYPPPMASVTRTDDATRRIEIARRIWGEARDAQRSPVAVYLAGRGVNLAPPASLRWVPCLRRPDGMSGPAMVARIDGPDGALIGVHRTWLDRGPDGSWRRRDRATLGRAAGGAVRLGPAAVTLLIGEGIETTLSGIVATGLPGWAALSTSGLVAMILPAVVRHVIVCADHDASGAGERAARAAAARWRAEGRQVSIYMSPCVGRDANECLLAARAQVRHGA